MDLDGTLADSLHLLHDVYIALLAEFGCTGSDEEFQELNGPPTDTVLAVLRQRHDLSDSPAELADRYRKLLVAGYLSVPPTRGAALLLQTARSVRLADGGRHIECGNDHPDLAGAQPTRHSGRRRGRRRRRRSRQAAPRPVSPCARDDRAARAADSIAVEDSSNGVRAAMSAHVPTHVLRRHDDLDLDAEDATLIPGVAGCIRSLDELVPVLQDREQLTGC